MIPYFEELDIISVEEAKIRDSTEQDEKKKHRQKNRTDYEKVLCECIIYNAITEMEERRNFINGIYQKELPLLSEHSKRKILECLEEKHYNSYIFQGKLYISLKKLSWKQEYLSLY